MLEPELNFYPEDIQSSSKEGDAFQPAYNTPNKPVSELNMQPSANGSVMTRDSMQSPNFVPGTHGAGWQIKSNGDATFQNITVNNVKEGGVISITVVPGDSLQTALNTINTQGGGTLYLSPGTYTINADLSVYDNTRIIGDSSNNTILDFNSQAYSIIWLGTDIYTTGTIASIGSGVNVVGSGTTWTAAMIGRQIFIDERWYVIVNVTDTTHLTIATGYADGATFAGTYRIANPVNNVAIKGVTIKNSTTTALEGTDIRDVTLNDVVFLSNDKGFIFTNFMNVVPESSTVASSTSNGYELTNGTFCNSYSVATVSNGGSGAVLNNIRSCGWILSAANSNTTDGFNLTDVDSCVFKVEASGNGSNGIEMVSGCDSNFVNDALISGNTSDGIKLTATSDNNTIGSSINITGNGGYGVNIAASTCDNNTLLSPLYLSNASGNYSDSGTGTIIITRSSTAGLFGGNGSDGALSVTSGTTNIDASSAKVVVKNYSSISISSGATLGVTNPSSEGTILILKSQGNITIDGTIELTSIGAAAGTDGFSVLDDNIHYGGAGTAGGNGSGGVGGTGGLIYSNKKLYITADADKLYRKFIDVACGAGGGNGGAGFGGAAGGAGGRGGGSMIIECGGALNFTANGIINLNGGNGSVGTNSTGDTGAGGGGGGGTSGMGLILYNTLTANSGTINAKGGSAGDGGTNTSPAGGGKYGGGGGAGGGSWTYAGKDGGSATGGAPGNGVNATSSEGASGGAGGGSAPSMNPGGTGGTQGATDSNHYLITQNKYFV